MLHPVSDILDRPVQGRDERLGTLSDLLVDSYTWDVRYLVVDTGGWLAGRQVLLAPEVVHQANWSEAEYALHVPLGQQQLEQSPHVETPPDVTRQQERALADYFGWTGYWHSGHPETHKPEAEPPAKPTPDLRSLRELRGYSLTATDGDLGHVEDFVLDLDHWIIRYLIVHTRNWLPGRAVLISPAWTEAIHWDDRHVRVHLSREQIKASPEYDPRQPIERQYETALHEAYDRPKYWLW